MFWSFGRDIKAEQFDAPEASGVDLKKVKTSFILRSFALRSLRWNTFQAGPFGSALPGEGFMFFELKFAMHDRSTPMAGVLVAGEREAR